MDSRGWCPRAVAMLGGCLASLLAMPTPTATAAPSRTAEPSAVGVRTVTFVDRGRPTPADPTAGITPAPNRRLPTTIYYPARGTPPPDGRAVGAARPARIRAPLVLFSPGSPGTAKDYEPLLLDWARAGYVVAAVEFPVSSLAGPDDVAWGDLPAQSADARFVLDKVLGLDPARAGIPTLDRRRVAVAGHSFGGATALSLVSKCCRDARVDAAVILAGVVETVQGPRLRQTRGPVLFAHARFDRAVPYTPVAELCAAVRGPKRLLTVEQIRGLRAHVDPYLGVDQYAAVVRPAIVDFLDGWLRGKSAARARLDRAGNGTMVANVSRCRQTPPAPG
jgi:pimeloyl-ACP methyl ester carboxylesterase